MTSFAHLQRIIAAQNEQNQCPNFRTKLVRKRKQHIKRVTIIRLKEKIAEYERLHHREAAMAGQGQAAFEFQEKGTANSETTE